MHIAANVSEVRGSPDAGDTLAFLRSSNLVGTDSLVGIFVSRLPSELVNLSNVDLEVLPRGKRLETSPTPPIVRGFLWLWKRLLR